MVKLGERASEGEGESKKLFETHDYDNSAAAVPMVYCCCLHCFFFFFHSNAGVGCFATVYFNVCYIQGKDLSGSSCVHGLGLLVHFLRSSN